MATWDIDGVDSDSKFRFDFPGCLETGMTSEASKIVVRCNMHRETKVIEVTDFESEVKFGIWGQWGCLEASEATKITDMKGNMHMVTRVIEAENVNSEVKIDLWHHLMCLGLGAFK